MKKFLETLPFVAMFCAVFVVSPSLNAADADVECAPVLEALDGENPSKCKVFRSSSAVGGSCCWTATNTSKLSLKYENTVEVLDDGQIRIRMSLLRPSMYLYPLVSPYKDRIVFTIDERPLYDCFRKTGFMNTVIDETGFHAYSINLGWRKSKNKAFSLAAAETCGVDVASYIVPPKAFEDAQPLIALIANETALTWKTRSDERAPFSVIFRNTQNATLPAMWPVELRKLRGDTGEYYLPLRVMHAERWSGGPWRRKRLDEMELFITKEKFKNIVSEFCPLTITFDSRYKLLVPSPPPA